MISIYVFSTIVLFGASVSVAFFVGWLCRGYKIESNEPAGNVYTLVNALTDLAQRPPVVIREPPQQANQPREREGIHPLAQSYLDTDETDPEADHHQSPEHENMVISTSPGRSNPGFPLIHHTVDMHGS